tara:strand:- start:151 stop:354 length:204 start_codon:yes stop_codon:yes gene_type:complete
MKKVTQKTLVFAHLKRKSITPLEALNLYGCFRLAAIIHKLRNSGMEIKTVNKTQNGKTFAQYFLIKE